MQKARANWLLIIEIYEKNIVVIPGTSGWNRLFSFSSKDFTEKPV